MNKFTIKCFVLAVCALYCSPWLQGAHALDYGNNTVLTTESAKDWRVILQGQIDKKRRYPRSARAREIEGDAKLLVTVSPTGEVTNFEIIKPTGFKVLDRQIPKLMASLSPVEMGAGVTATQSLTVSVTWSLE